MNANHLPTTSHCLPSLFGMGAFPMLILMGTFPMLKQLSSLLPPYCFDQETLASIQVPAPGRCNKHSLIKEGTEGCDALHVANGRHGQS